MAASTSSFCNTFYRYFCCCLPNSGIDSKNDERFRRVFPSMSQEAKLSFNCFNDDDFIHIPREVEMDKFINYHKDSEKFTMEHALQAEGYIEELKKLNIKYSKGRSRASSNRIHGMGGYAVSEPNKLILLDTSEDTDSKKNPAHLIIDVQKGRFFWPDELKKLRNPFVRIKIVSIRPASGRSSTEVSIDHDVLTAYETFSSMDPVNPDWNQTFSHTFDDIDTKSPDNAFRVCLVYYGENSEQVLIGSEQTFFLKELIDQQVKTKEVSFKHGKSLGLIAKVAIRLQFIHDEASVSKKVLQSIEYRLEQLGKIKHNNIEVFKQALQKNILFSSAYNAESKDCTPADGSYVFENGITMT